MRYLILLVVVLLIVVDSTQRCIEPQAEGCFNKTSVANNLFSFSIVKNILLRNWWIQIKDMLKMKGEAALKEDKKELLYIGYDMILQLPSFTHLTNCSVPRIPLEQNDVRRFNHYTTVIDGRLTVCGGTIYYEPTDNCSTLVEGSWAEGVTPNMLKTRANAAYSWTKKGLFVTGGLSHYNGNIQLTDTTEFLTKSGEWEFGPRMPRALKKHCQVSVGSDVYVLGGDTYEDVEMGYVYRLSEGDSDWTILKDMEFARFYHGCAVHNNYIYALGGLMWYPGLSTVQISERLDLSTMTWERLPKLPAEFDLGYAFSFQSSLYLVDYSFSGLVVRLAQNNRTGLAWEETHKPSNFSRFEYESPSLVTADILDC